MGIVQKLFLTEANDIKQRTRWYIRTRWFFLLAVIIPGLLSNYIGEGFSPQVRRDLALGILALSTNLLATLLSRARRSEKYFRRLGIGLLILDIAIITVLIFIKGGIESRSPILYTIPMLMASAMFGQFGVYYSAALSVVLYDLLILADWLHVIHSIGSVNPGLRDNGTYVLNTVTFFTSVLLIIALLADFITRLLKNQQKALNESTQALEEAQAIAKLGSWSWDVTSDKIHWSKGVATIFGLSAAPHDFAGYLDSVHPDDRARVERIVRSALETKQPFEFDHRVNKQDHLVWILGRGQVAVSATGSVIRMFGSVQDITETKLAALKVDDKNKELEKINSLLVGRELKMIELKAEIKKLKKVAS